MKKIIALSLLTLLCGLLATAQAASYANYWIVNTIDEFNYYNIWFNGQTAVIENFEDANLIPGLSITEVNGPGLIQLGYYQNIVDAAINRYQVFNYSGKMNGFGGWFDLFNPGGPGSSIDVYVGNDYVGNIPNTYKGEFWGFFSTVPFAAVTFVEGPGDPQVYVQETYQIVDLAICPVPVPATLLLFASGVLGLVGLSLRRKAD